MYHQLWCLTCLEPLVEKSRRVELHSVHGWCIYSIASIYKNSMYATSWTDHQKPTSSGSENDDGSECENDDVWIAASGVEKLIDADEPGP